MDSKANNIVCPQCEIVLRPPFKMCSEGHFLCQHCRQHVDADSGETVKSTTCGNKEFGTSQLNKLLRNLSDDCQYGCGYRTNIVDISHHEETCPLNAKCAINACHWTGGLSKLVKHCEAYHPGRLVDVSTMDDGFNFGFEHPTLLLTQHDKNNSNNDIYWLRLLKNNNCSQYIVMQHQGHIGRKTDDKFLIKEFSIHPSNNPKISIACEVLFTKTDGENILNDKFVEKMGTDITPLNVDNFVINIKKTSPQISETLTTNLECSICSEIMFAPIRMCYSSHNICGSCCDKIKNKCTRCQKEIIPYVRNYALETLSENILLSKRLNRNVTTIPKLRCVYKKSGCQFTSTGNMQSHEMACYFQPKKCSQCNWEGTYKEFIDHVNTICCREIKKTVQTESIQEIFQRSHLE